MLFYYLSAVYEEFLLVGGWQVYSGNGCRPIAKSLDGGCHLGGGEGGRGAKVLYCLSLLVDVGAEEDVLVAVTLEDVQFYLVERKAILGTEVAQEDVEVGILP